MRSKLAEGKFVKARQRLEQKQGQARSCSTEQNMKFGMEVNNSRSLTGLGTGQTRELAEQTFGAQM